MLNFSMFNYVGLNIIKNVKVLFNGCQGTSEESRMGQRLSALRLKNFAIVKIKMRLS